MEISETPVGFEPTNKSFADSRLDPLVYGVVPIFYLI